MKTKLTPTEREVMFLLASGYTKKEVANIRNTSIRTIESQCKPIYQKKDCRNLADLTRVACSKAVGIDIQSLIKTQIAISVLILLTVLFLWLIKLNNTTAYVEEVITKYYG